MSSITILDMTAVFPDMICLLILAERTMSHSYAQPVDPLSVNMNPKKLQKVIALFHQQQADGAFPGGQMVVRRYGEVVVNEHIGMARPAKSPHTLASLVQEQTPFPIYSAGKPIAAIVIALMEDRALLDVTAPISDLLPEFAAHGKEQINTLDVLTHTAGILIPSSYTLDPEKLLVWQMIVEAKPMYSRGTFAYMPLEYGIILNEIVLRVTGKTLAEFLHTEIAIPLNLPALQYGLAQRDINTLAYSFWLGKTPIKIYDVLIANVENSINSAVCFNSMNPAYNMITDANTLAEFYEFLVRKGVSSANKRVISQQTLDKYTHKAVSGWNKTLKIPLSMGRGFTLGGLLPSAYGWWNTLGCFGHGGLFSSLAFGDHRTQLAVAIITNGNRSLYDFYKRFLPLTHGIRQACM